MITEYQLPLDCVQEMEKKVTKPGRLLTVRLTVTDPEKAQWLWNMHNNPELGVHITALSNGDLFAANDLMEQTLSELHEDSSMWDTDLIQDTFDKLDKMMLEHSGL